MKLKFNLNRNLGLLKHLFILQWVLGTFHLGAQPFHIESNSNPSFPHLRLTEIGQDFSRITLDNTAQPGKFWTIAGETHSSSTPRINFYYHNGVFGADRFTVTAGGRVGINTTNPEAELQVNGFTKLGNESPEIKMKKLTGIFPDLETQSTSLLRFPHGIADHTKILGFHMHVESPGTGLTSAASVPPAFKSWPAAQYDYIIETDHINIYTTKNKSAYIAGYPYRILIIYEE